MSAAGFVVYGCDHAVADKAKRDGKPPRLKALSKVYHTKQAADDFARLASTTFAKLEVRQK